MIFKKHYYDFLFPVVALAVLTIAFHQTNLDEWLAGHFISSGVWKFRNSFLLEKVLHKGGVLFTATIILGIILSLFWVWSDSQKRQLKNLLVFILTSSLLTIISVSLLKNFTTLPCPWNTLALSGVNSSPSIWMMFSLGLPKQHCFPGGHSSAGFAFLSIYYGYIFAYGKRNFISLIPGLLIGLLFGFTQQARGAHFMSHDFATAFVSVCCSWMTFLIYSKYNKNYEALDKG
jgi:membrane-associated PAP2 superfamily phosphatase